MSYPMANYLARFGFMGADGLSPAQQAARQAFHETRRAIRESTGYYGDDFYGADVPSPMNILPNPERRRARCEAFLARQGGATVTAPEAVSGFYGADAWDDTDDVDVAELIGDDDEIEEMGADDEGDAFGSDGDEAMGATITQVEKRIDKLSDKLTKLEAKLAATPATKAKKRKHLLKQIARVKAHIARKEAKKEKKVGIIAAKMGLPAAALLGGGLAAGGTAAALGYSSKRAQRIEDRIERARADQLAQGAAPAMGTPMGGTEVRIPLVDGSGSPVFRISVVPGAGLRTAAVSLASQIIPFANFEVRGLDVKVLVTGSAAFELMPNFLIDSLIVGGGINLIYQQQAVEFAAQTPSGQLSGVRTLSGLRATPTMDANNTATLVGLFRQEITNAQQIEVSIQASLICIATYDAMARRSS